MYMGQSLKEKCRKLYNKGISYREIEKILKCSRATISFHCSDIARQKRLEADKYTFELIKQYREFYDKCRNLAKTARYFGISSRKLRRYLDVVKLTENQIKSKAVRRRQYYRQKIKVKAVEYKGGECERCGYNKSTWALDLHHLDPSQKDFSISGGTKSFEKIKKELDKCILVCRNCHSEIHEQEYLSRHIPSA
jgi:hypothetical protein